MSSGSRTFPRSCNGTGLVQEMPTSLSVVNAHMQSLKTVCLEEFRSSISQVRKASAGQKQNAGYEIVSWRNDEETKAWRADSRRRLCCLALFCSILNVLTVLEDFQDRYERFDIPLRLNNWRSACHDQRNPSFRSSR